MVRFLRLGIAACLCLPIFLTGSAVAQQPGVEFAVEPGPQAQTTPRGGYFVIKARPGRRVRQSLSLRNESGRSITLQLAAVDATTGQLGGVSYAVPEDAVEVTGTWLALDKKKVPLEPGEARSVGFEVVIPQDAIGGEHLAGIAVWEAGEEEKGGEEETVSVNVQTRRIVAVQVNLPGPRIPELVVTGIEAAARPDGLYLEIGIENQGSAMTSGEGTVELPTQAFLRDFAVDTFVPGTSIGYPVKWTDQPQEGVYEARVEIAYDGQTAEWAGSVIVGDPVLEDLEDRGVEVPSRFPILPVGGAAAVIVAAVVGWWSLRRRRAGSSIPAGRPITPTRRPASSAHAPGATSSPPKRVTLPSAASRPRYPTSGPPPPPPPT